MRTIREGSAAITLSEGAFYNPKMTPLRDISVLFLRAAGASGSLLDSTSATGVRGIRYSKEANFKDVTFLEINEDVARNTVKNVKANGLKSKVLNQSIQEFSSSWRGDGFDVIDLDPFGSPMPNLNDVLKLAKDGTLLMVTATDTAVLCGAQTKACMKIYGSKPMHNELCKESGIRILLNHVIGEAAKFNFGTEVLLSVSDMHYMRVFVRLRSGAERAVGAVKECGAATFCAKCHSFSFAKGLSPFLEADCTRCGGRNEAFGPMFLGKLYKKELLNDMVLINRGGAGKESLAAGRQLLMLYGELDLPFFYAVPKLTRNLGISSVSTDGLISAIKERKFRATRTQFDHDGVKTDAPLGVVLECMKRLGREQKAKE